MQHIALLVYVLACAASMALALELYALGLRLLVRIVGRPLVVAGLLMYVALAVVLFMQLAGLQLLAPRWWPGLSPELQVIAWLACIAAPTALFYKRHIKRLRQLGYFR